MQAYFGKDSSRYAERSALPGLRASTLPMLFAHAELDPADFQQQAAQLRAALCDAGRCRPMLKLLGHNHPSEVFSINTTDRALSDNGCCAAARCSSASTARATAGTRA